MRVELDLLEILMVSNNTNSCKYTLHLNEKEYELEDVSIINSPTPVNSPTTRGGVYFSEKFAYKLKGSIHDLSVVPLLSKTMLGPNTEFREIKITAEVTNKNQKKDFSIFTNLTNSIQGPSKIELNMIIIKLQEN
ncbi:MAG: hypothetical protein OEM79_05125 [Nitrosopumilus sp.]|nr:hypothetical protein [Nitrosopumilus sp.]